MVKVREAIRGPKGEFNQELWLKQFSYLPNYQDKIINAINFAESISNSHLGPFGELPFEHSLQMAEVLCSLHADESSIVASIIFPAVAFANYSLAEISINFGCEVAKIVDGAIKMEALSVTTNKQITHDSSQLDKLRKMILAMADDIRVVLIKLADHLCTLRIIKNSGEQERHNFAIITQDIFAPLTNRLGVGQLKWEMEDLAFRYLHPAVYKTIARLLDERRVDRERYIKRLKEEVTEALKIDNLKAKVQGRVKHIYSIWRKMQRKNLDYNEIYDVRAIRILVNNVQECYFALGTVHRMWKHIPKEFDDYIATPKENGYRSLHTAVIGPEGKTVEVQIRTHAMHNECELGIAAHWRYKEGAKQDLNFDNKVLWLRQLIDWQDEVVDAVDLIDELKTKVIEERVYVLTPKGDVLDLPKGSTPLDFAYNVHTSIGHRCRGAKVNGRIVPLTYNLQTGDRIEIITGTTENPSRDWVNKNLGYIVSSKARNKIQQWFKSQAKDDNIVEGRSILEKELHRLGVIDLDWQKILKKINFHNQEDAIAAIGTGDLRVSQILNAAGVALTNKENIEEELFFQGDEKNKLKNKSGEITIYGVGNLLTTVAGCCTPVPGDEIVGYITQGKGVTVHRRNCTNVLHLPELRQSRLIDVEWSTPGKRYPVNIMLESYDRANLLKDIIFCLSSEKINVINLQSMLDKSSNIVHSQVCIEIDDLTKLRKVMDKLNHLHNVVKVYRTIS